MVRYVARHGRIWCWAPHHRRLTEGNLGSSTDVAKVYPEPVGVVLPKYIARGDVKTTSTEHRGHFEPGLKLHLESDVNSTSRRSA